MKLGYVRVSESETHHDTQLAALQDAGAVRIWQDRGVSGSAVLKPAYREMLDYAQPGDEIVVWRLDRLARSLGTLMFELDDLAKRSLGLHALAEGIVSPAGDGGAFFGAVSAFRRFERDALQERAEADRYAADRRSHSEV
ncbi:recombinase family protein [Novosphingobium sp. 9]|uniref:recombinase family protein n=1 Tax=Novosphingobium sp. 9 TaxID=2025349 RepID=UPI0021B59A47|nr:recombinase family protein [Novosphingobium sp. 9]